MERFIDVGETLHMDSSIVDMYIGLLMLDMQ